MVMTGMVAAFVLSVGQAPRAATSSQRAVPTTWTGSAALHPADYQVTLTGTVSGNSFRRTASLRLIPTVAKVGTNNGVNSIDLCLRSGFPAGVPEIGAIWFGSNSGCFNAPAQLDMVYLEETGNTVTMRPDSRIAATGANSWTPGSGVVACIYYPIDGSASFTFSGASVSGSIALRGYSSPTCSNSDYRATVAGSLS
jgi:hypothetical protein